MAAPRRSNRSYARASAKRRGHPPRHALRRPSLRRFRFHAFASRSRGVFTHGAFLEKIDRFAHASPAPALSVAREWPRLLHWPPDASPGRLRLRAGMGRKARGNPRENKNTTAPPPPPPPLRAKCEIL